MKSISEHNNELSRVYQKQNSLLTGIKCPECNAELMYADDSIYTSNPPQRKVMCSCGYIGFVLA